MPRNVRANERWYKLKIIHDTHRSWRPLDFSARSSVDSTQVLALWGFYGAEDRKKAKAISNHDALCVAVGVIGMDGIHSL